MASRKEYEMLFMLNASMGNSFNSTFKTAQSSIANMQREIQSLSKTQSDISAYEKQQGAIEKTKEKLSYLEQQYDNVQKEIDETGTYSSKLENEKLRLQQQIEKTKSSLEQQNEKLDAMGGKLQNAGVDTNNLAQESKRLETQISELKDKEVEAAESAEQFGSTASDSFSALSQTIATLGIIQTFKDMAAAYKECVDITMTFEAEMSNVEALSGATSDEMEQLTDKAKDLGATTKFTAQQSAEAMGYMGMAGWNAQQMLSGMDGVLQLAAASGEDLAMVSDVVTDNLTAFGMQASDTARFADVLAAAATNSNTNVAIMAETFKNCASIAGALGYDVEDVATAVGLMANSGIKGSVAGTALKNVFNGLLEGVTLTSDAFGEYEFSALKSDGTMKTFMETVEELRDRFSEMTEAERVNNAMTIAGKRSYNGLLAIVNATDEDFASLANNITNSTGAAKKMAEVKMDNVQGQMVLMESASEALKTSLGELTQNEMRSLYKMATEILQKLNEFVKANPGLVKAIGAFIAIIGAATIGVTAFDAAQKLAAASAGLLEAAMGPVGWAIMGVSAAVAGLTALVVANNNRLVDGEHTYAELTAAANDAQESLKATREAFSDSAEETMAATSVANHYIDKLEELEVGGLKTAESQKEYHNYLELLCQTVPELAEYIDLENDKILISTSALRENTEEWKKNAIAQAYQEQRTELYAKYSEVLVEQQKNSIRLTKAEDALTEAQKKHDKVLEDYTNDINQAQEAANEYNKKYMASATYEQFLTKTTDEWNRAIEDSQREINKCEDAVDSINKAISEDAEAVQQANEELALADEAIQQLTNSEKDAADESDVLVDKTDDVNNAIYGVSESVSALSDLYQAAYQSALESIQGQYNLWDEAAKIVPTKIDDINKALDTQISYWEDYNKNLSTLEGMTGQVEGLDEVLSSFADGSEESVNAIAGLADAAEKSPEKLQLLVDKYKKLQEEQEETASSIAELKTDYESEMAEIVSEITSDVQSLGDLSEDAKQAGNEAIQAFIDSAKWNLPAVTTAYQNIANAARSALQIKSIPTIRGYASGTNNAERGVKLVGEEGPELVYFNGGEKVLDAQQTALQAEGLSASSGGDNNIAINFNIEGSADNSTVNALQRYADDFAARVLEVISDAGADNLRRAYA